jgi:hypothetical protein
MVQGVSQPPLEYVGIFVLLQEPQEFDDLLAIRDPLRGSSGTQCSHNAVAGTLDEDPRVGVRAHCAGLGEKLA